MNLLLELVESSLTITFLSMKTGAGLGGGGALITIGSTPALLSA